MDHPGAAVGVTLWLLASAAFSAFIAHFSSFNVTYGSFAAAIKILIWLWLTNVALVFGAEVNAEIERQKKLAEGVPESRTLNLPPCSPITRRPSQPRLRSQLALDGASAARSTRLAHSRGAISDRASSGKA